jgi:hypothetical protein
MKAALNYCHAFGGFVTNNNGFWIRRLDLLALRLQLQPIVTAHNQWLRLAPFLTGLQVSSLPLWRMQNEEFLLTLSTALNGDWWILSSGLVWPPFIASGNRIEITASKGSPTALHECVLSETCMNRCPANGIPLLSVAIPGFRRCLPNRCIFVTLY